MDATVGTEARPELGTRNGTPSVSVQDPVAVTRVLTVVRHPVGGIRTYLKYVYSRLPRDKYRFTIVAVAGIDENAYDLDLRDVAFEYIEVPGRGHLGHLVTQVERTIRSGQFDLIHSHGFTAGVAAVVANIPHRIRHVLTSHDVLRDAHFRPPLGRVKKLILTRLLAQATVIQSVTNDAQANLLTYLPRLASSELAVVVNGIDVDRFSGRPQHQAGTWRAGLKIREDALLFAFLGRMMPQKGFKHLIEAVAGLAADPAVTRPFVVAVVSDGAFIREHRTTIESLGLSRYFRFVGFMPDVSEILKQVDVMVMPSLWEACGLLAMESLVAGCPVIASTCVGLREVIQGTPAVGVPPEDSTALALAMKRALTDSAALTAETLDYVPAAKLRYDARLTADALDRLFQKTLVSSDKSRKLRRG